MRISPLSDVSSLKAKASALWHTSASDPEDVVEDGIEDLVLSDESKLA